MLLFTDAIPRPAIWGGTLLRDYFHYPHFPDTIGQSWSFSAQEGEGLSNVFTRGGYAGQTLLQVWREHPELFRSRHTRFPVIISLVAPMDDLSLQIHPDDDVAAKSGYPTGKNEAWYFLEAEENASIVYGQSTKNEQQLRSLIAQDRWNEIMQHLPVSQGDFVYLPAGMVHAMKKGSIVYEIQQATDVTYRFFDYHRKDKNGNERPLQLEEAISCVHYDLTQAEAHPTPVTQQLPSGTVTTFIQNDSFCVRRYVIRGRQQFAFTHYQLMTCVKGEGTINGIPLSVGESVLITVDETVTLEGDMTLLCTSEA